MKKSLCRTGLTLLELVVVLVILVALAGILVPLLPGMIDRAHTAEHATNISEVNKAVETFNVMHRGYPNNLDNLTAWSVLSGSGANSACSGQLESKTLSGDELLALNSAGLTNVYTLTTSGSRDLVTAPYSATAAIALSSSTAGLSTVAATRLYNLTASSSEKYVVFGLGTGCTMIGHGLPEAPLHFSDENGTAGDPTKTYARFGLVFRVSDTGGVALERAQFVGAVALHEGGVTNGNDAAAEYHKQSAQ